MCNEQNKNCTSAKTKDQWLFNYTAEPDAMAEAARIAETAQPEIIDLNFGCPVKKMAGKGAGAGLLCDIPKMLAITKSVVNAVSIPVTVKLALGGTIVAVLL